jgi:hypothetical protein
MHKEFAFAIMVTIIKEIIAYLNANRDKFILLVAAFVK